MENKEWNLIDLHIHSFAGVDRKGKKDNVVFSYLDFAKIFKNHSLKLISTLGHNKFDLSNYLLCKYISNIYGCNDLPGVELDTNIDDKNELHIVCIFDGKLQKLMNFANIINSKSIEM